MDDIDVPALSLTTDQLHLQSPEAVDYHLDIAGIGARSHAFIIDWHIRLLLALSWFFAVGLVMHDWEDLSHLLWQDNNSSSALILIIPTAMLYFLYHPVLEIIMTGRTPGKRMAGIRIVTTQGLTPSVGALLLRNLFRLLDSLPSLYIVGLISCSLNKHRARIGDLASGLLLVYAYEVNTKQLDKVTALAMHSPLSPQDQALLLDLLARWQHLHSLDKIHLAEKFLNHIGAAINANSAKPAPRIAELKFQLEQLTVIKSNHSNGY